MPLIFPTTLMFFNVIPYAEVYGTHPKCLAATSEGFLHTSDHYDLYTSNSGSIMQARHAKVNKYHDHAAIQRYRQSMLDRMKVSSTLMSKHAIAHKLDDDRTVSYDS